MRSDGLVQYGMIVTELIYASSQGHIGTVHTLILDSGVDVDVRDKDGRTPLIWAAKNGHTELVTTLISCYNSNVYHRDSRGKTALMYAAGAGLVDTVNALISHGSDIEDGGLIQMTPLMCAARNGCTEVVDVLITLGVDVHATDRSGLTAAAYAAESGCRETLALLMPHIVESDAYYVTRASNVAIHRGYMLENEPEGDQEQSVEEMTPSIHSSSGCNADTHEESDGEIDECVEPSPCVICLSNKLNVVFVPCGHCACYSCYKKMRRARERLHCHICQGLVEKTQKLYI